MPVGLRRREPQRMVDAGGERDLDGVAGEFEVDQVAGAVAGQPAHPELVEVVASCLTLTPRSRRGLGAGDLRVGLEVRHHVEQPDQPARDGGHALTSSVPPARAAARPRRRAATAGLERDGVGAVAGDLAGQPVGHADVDGDLLARRGRASARGADHGGLAAQRGGAALGDPDPGLRSPVGATRRPRGATISRRFDPRRAGAPRRRGPIGVHVGARCARAGRCGWRRGRGHGRRGTSGPRCGDHAPRLDRAGGVRVVAGRPVLELHHLPGVDGGQQDSEHLLRAAQAGQRGGRGDRDAGSRAASTSTPAARSLSRALWVAVISSGDCHSWVATATGGGLLGGQLDRRQGVGLAG